MRSRARGEPTQITLPNAALPSAPLVIDGPVSLVVVLANSWSPLLTVQRILVARTLHTVISELYPRSTLRFVRNDRYEQVVEKQLPDSTAVQLLKNARNRWSASLAECERLTVEAPDMSLSYSAISASIDKHAAALRSHPFIRSEQPRFDPERPSMLYTIVAKTWEPRALETPRPFAIPSSLAKSPLGAASIAVHEGDETRATHTLVEPALAQVAFSDGFPTVLMLDEAANGAACAAAAAELLELPATLGFFAISSGPRWDGEPARRARFGAEDIAAQVDERTLRHWLLCNVWWKPQRLIETAGAVISEHAEQCRQRTARTIRARDEAQVFLQSASGSEPLRDAVRDELEERYLAFVCALRTGFDLEVASQSVVRVCKTLNRVVREADVAGAREALAMLESMASIVGIA